MTTIITGSRDWTNVSTILSAIKDANPDKLVHGAARGADTIADTIARDLHIRIIDTYPAQWNKYGKAAGMIRNRFMLDVNPDATVLAFPLPQSIGTLGMIREATTRGHHVIVYNVDGTIAYERNTPR